jgi:putative flavoprotein involved in K+ transport
MSEHINTVVIGGGQAGLSASWHLKHRGTEHVILDHGRIGDAWRQRWDSFCLITPNWGCDLPEFPYDGDDPKGFMQRDEIISYVERFAASFDPPYRGGVEVLGLSTSSNGGRFQLDTSEGALTADSVIVATGPFQQPSFPEWADKLSDEIECLHTGDYRNPEQLPSGAVLVVGSAQSGCQIVEDLQAAGRNVHLCVGKAGRVERRYRGRDFAEWVTGMGIVDLPVDQHPEGHAIRFKPHPHFSGRDGGHTINLRSLALDGINLYGRGLDAEGSEIRLATDLAENLEAIDAGCNQLLRRVDAYIANAGIDAPESDVEPVDWRPLSEPETLDLKKAGITSVIFATGYRLDFDWIDLPIFDDDKYPRYERGVTEVPGLYFLGLHWLYTWGSGTFIHVGRDAEYVIDHIARSG